MEVFFDILKTTIPTAIVGYLAYLLVRSFLQSKLEEVSLAVSQKNQETVLPIRLQAYERVCLLLERINPVNLVQRLNNGKYTAAEFQQILIHEIREEFNHNLSQQVYMSSEAWTYVTTAVEQVISEVNTAFTNLNDDSTSIDLTKAILEQENGKEVHILTESLNFVKQEIQVLF